MAKYNRLLLLVLAVIVICLFFGKDLFTVNKDSWVDLAEDVSEFDVLATDMPEIYPEHLIDSGEKYFGNGYDPEAQDIISVIERMIWDMPTREEQLYYERLYYKK